MAKRRYGKKRRASRSKSIPLSIMAPLAYIAMERIYPAAKKGDFNQVNQALTGYSNGHFYPLAVTTTYGPLVVGIVAHKIANRVGVNNMVRRATMGYLSI